MSWLHAVFAYAAAAALSIEVVLQCSLYLILHV